MADATRKAWGWFGTPAAVRVISVGMLLYAVLIGALFGGYVKVQSCQASYADKSATATAARADIAREDRELDEKDRQARDRAEVALDNALAALVAVPNNQQKTGLAFANLVAVRKEVAAVRVETNRQRAENELERQQSPPPPPPSQTC